MELRVRNLGTSAAVFGFVLGILVVGGLVLEEFNTRVLGDDDPISSD